MPVIVTPGATDANSYATEAEFASYAANRLPVPTFNPSDVTIVTPALIMSARTLDACFEWHGMASNPDVQALTWPRVGMLNRNKGVIAIDAIPQALKDAQCELAFQVLGGLDTVDDNSAAVQGVSSVKAGSVEVAFQRVDMSTIEGADTTMRRLLTKFAYLSAAIPGEVRRLLVDTWYHKPSIRRKAFISIMGPEHPRDHRRDLGFDGGHGD